MRCLLTAHDTQGEWACPTARAFTQAESRSPQLFCKRLTLVALASLIERKRGAEGARKAAAAIAALKTSNWSANREAVRADALEGAGETPMPTGPREASDRRCPARRRGHRGGRDPERPRPARRFIRSGITKAYFGLGSGGIGFAMAGAVGVQLALPGAACGRRHRRRQCDVQHPGFMDRRKRQASHHLRHRQQRRLPHHSRND